MPVTSDSRLSDDCRLVAVDTGTQVERDTQIQIETVDWDWGKSWMGQAEESILQVCQLTDLKQTQEWEKYPNRFRHLYETLSSAGKLGKALSRMASRKSGSSFKKTASRRTS